jgi:AbrB family looped-hinge helix DNA binding protein
MLRDNLIMLRNVHGYSQEELAEKINISRQAYAKWEKGETIPDVEKCQKLAEVYGTTIDALLKTERIDGVRGILPAPKGKHMWGSVTMNERGQIVIPKAVRDNLSLKDGERLIVLSEDNEGIALVPAQIFEKRMKDALEFLSIQADE